LSVCVESQSSPTRVTSVATSSGSSGARWSYAQPYVARVPSCRVSIAATLFDMDGLLIDSEILWHKAEVEIFGSLGVPLYRVRAGHEGVFVNEVVTTGRALSLRNTDW